MQTIGSCIGLIAIAVLFGLLWTITPSQSNPVNRHLINPILHVLP